MPPTRYTNVTRQLGWRWRAAVARNEGSRLGTTGVGRNITTYQRIADRLNCAGQGGGGGGMYAGQNGLENPAVQKQRVSSRRRLLPGK